jgi:hypothetical protein
VNARERIIGDDLQANWDDKMEAGVEITPVRE